LKNHFEPVVACAEPTLNDITPTTKADKLRAFSPGLDRIIFVSSRLNWLRLSTAPDQRNILIANSESHALLDRQDLDADGFLLALRLFL